MQYQARVVSKKTYLTLSYHHVDIHYEESYRTFIMPLLILMLLLPLAFPRYVVKVSNVSLNDTSYTYTIR